MGELQYHNETKYSNETRDAQICEASLNNASHQAKLRLVQVVTNCVGGKAQLVLGGAECLSDDLCTIHPLMFRQLDCQYR